MEQDQIKNFALHLCDIISFSNGAIEAPKHVGILKPGFSKVIHFKATGGFYTKGLSLRWMPSTNKKTFQLRYKFLKTNRIMIVEDI